MTQPAILWSRAGMGGTGALLDALLEYAARGEQCFWIVPEPYSHATERLLAERGGAPVCLHAEVLTFRRLTDHILAAAGGLAAPTLDAGGRLLMMRRAVRAVSGQLTALQPAAAKPGFLPGLIQTLDECKCYGITPALLERAGQNASGTAANRLFDLALIFASYDLLCSQAKNGQHSGTPPVDPRDRMTLAREKLPDVSFNKDAHVFVSNFASFTPQERLLLTALADGAASFTLLLCGDLTCQGFDPLRAAARRISSHFPQGCSHTTVSIPEKGRADALRYMERTWFDRKPAPFAGDTAPIELWNAPGEAAEVRFAAEHILRLVRHEGYRWRDIVIIASDYGAYGSLLESIFPLYGIPLFADNMDEMSKKPIARAVRALAGCVRYGCRADDVMSLLRTGLLPFSAEDIDLFENYLRRWNPRGNRFSGETDWTRPPGGYHGDPNERDIAELARINAVRRHIAGALKVLPGGRSAPQCAERLLGALSLLGTPERIEARAKELEDAGEQKLAAEYPQIWDLFLACLEQCVSVLGDDPMMYEEFCELCLLVLSGYSVGTIPPSLDRVHAGDQSRLARLPVPVVIYLGANADKVPARAAGDGLLASEERAALDGIGCELPPNPPSRIEREQYNLYTACTLPSQKLILTYTRTVNGCLFPGEDGHAGVIRRLAAIFSLPVRPVPPPLPPREPHEPDLSPLSPQRVTSLYGQTLRISASRLESFRTCPFAYFVRYGLRAARRPEPGFTPLDVGLELHAVMEECARFAYDKGGFSQVTRLEMQTFAADTAQARQDSVLRRGGVGTPRLLAQGARLARTAAMLAGRLWDEFTHSLFKPLDFELALEGAVTPLHGHPPGAPDGFTVRGVADRADGYLCGDTLFLRVVDYKTGNKDFSLRDVYHGVSAQMPLYLFLLQTLAPERYRVRRAQAAGVLYVPAYDAQLYSDGPLLPEQAALAQNTRLRHSGLLLDDIKVLEAMDTRLHSSGGVLPVAFTKDGTLHKRTLVATPEQMDSLQAYIQSLVKQTARDIACGSVSSLPLDRPGGSSPCLYCDARAACHYDENSGEARPMRGFTNREDFFEAIL